MPSTVANHEQASGPQSMIGHLIRFFRPDQIRAPEGRPSESGLTLVWSVIAQAKFSNGPRNACPELPGLRRRLLRQPWHDGQMAAWRGRLSDASSNLMKSLRKQQPQTGVGSGFVHASTPVPTYAGFCRARLRVRSLRRNCRSSTYTSSWPAMIRAMTRGALV